jgi:hypothetical protein
MIMIGHGRRCESVGFLTVAMRKSLLYSQLIICIVYIIANLYAVIEKLSRSYTNTCVILINIAEG